MEIRIDVAKTSKFGSEVSGDTVEVIERPQGGLSLIIADGQGSGSSARPISSFVVNKVVSLIADGARDGAVAQPLMIYFFLLSKQKSP